VALARVDPTLLFEDEPIQHHSAPVVVAGRAGTSEVPGAIVEMSLRDKEGLWDDIWRVGVPGRPRFSGRTLGAG
jgi:hypothetical protein